MKSPDRMSLLVGTEKESPGVPEDNEPIPREQNNNHAQTSQEGNKFGDRVNRALDTLYGALKVGSIEL